MNTINKLLRLKFSNSNNPNIEGRFIGIDKFRLELIGVPHLIRLRKGIVNDKDIERRVDELYNSFRGDLTYKEVNSYCVGERSYNTEGMEIFYPVIFYYLNE